MGVNERDTACVAGWEVGSCNERPKCLPRRRHASGWRPLQRRQCTPLSPYNAISTFADGLEGQILAGALEQTAQHLHWQCRHLIRMHGNLGAPALLLLQRLAGCVNQMMPPLTTN